MGEGKRPATGSDDLGEGAAEDLGNLSTVERGSLALERPREVGEAVDVGRVEVAVRYLYTTGGKQ